MSKHRVVVADQSKARIFTVADSRGALLEVGELQHPEARDREQALTSDRPGRSFDSKGQGRHALGSRVAPGKQETIHFAKQNRTCMNGGPRRRFRRLCCITKPYPASCRISALRKSPSGAG